MTTPRPYHHGNLRQAVLDRAAVAVRERGAAELSLRELASEIGVTHAAPRRYFPDRQALLDAVAVDGFARLGARLREAVAASAGYGEQVGAIAAAYAAFATAEPNLVELMFAHKRGAGGPLVGQAAAEAFAPMLAVFQLGPTDDPERTGLGFLATLQGVTGLVACGVIPVERLDDVLGDAVARFTA